MPERTLDEVLNQAIEAMLTGTAVAVSGPELEPLARVARMLSEMPDEGFQLRLKTELQRRAVMKATVESPVREGFRTVTPYISVPSGAELIEFLKRTFGAEELSRRPQPWGFHAELRIGDSMLMVGGGEAIRGRERTGAFHVYVPDCDAAYRRALEVGASSLGEPADQPYGERSGFVKDPSGNHWYIATRFPTVTAPEGVGAVLPFLFPSKARTFIEFVKRAFGAEEMGVFEEGGRVMHAAVRIGDAVLEMGEPEGERPSFPSRFFVYVRDCDASYRRAIEAGATVVEPPAERHRHRMAVVTDPFGYEWMTATLL